MSTLTSRPIEQLQVSPRRLGRAVKNGVWRLIFAGSHVVDRAVDKLLGISTHGNIRYLAPRGSTRLSTAEQAYDCVATPYYALWKILRHSDLSPTDVIYDIGAGFGRSTFAFALKQIAKSLGVEFEPSAIAKCKDNLAMFRGNPNKVDFVQADATAVDLDEATVLFMFNPLREAAMFEFARNIEASLVRHPRRIKIIYYTPLHENCLQGIAGYREIKRFNALRKACLVAEIIRA